MKVGLRTTYGPRVQGTGRWYSCDKVAAVSRQEEIIADNAHLGTLPAYARSPYSWQPTSAKFHRARRRPYYIRLA